MNRFFTDLKNEARRERLLPEERQRMRVKLYDAMRAPIISHAPIQSPIRPTQSPFVFISTRFMLPVCAVLVVVLGSGTALAAQGSLPGDALYTVKINVNEQLQSALALSDVAKVEVHAELAQKRLEEAETLAASGKLTASTSATLAANYDEHIKVSQTVAHILSQSDPDTAVELSAQIDSSLAAHGAILVQLGDDSDNEQTKEDSNSLAAHVHSRDLDEGHVSATLAMTAIEPESTATIRPQSKVALVSTSSASSTIVAPVATSVPKSKISTSPNFKQQKSTLRLQTQASSTLDLAMRDFAAIQSTLSTSTNDQIRVQITMASSLLSQGSTSLSVGDYSSAAEKFSDALRLSNRLDTYLKAGKKFNKKMLSSLLSGLSGSIESTSKGQDVKGTTDTKDSSSNASTTIEVQSSTTLQNILTF